MANDLLACLTRLVWLCSLWAFVAQRSEAFSLIIEGKECMSEHIDTGDTLTGSFVVLDIDSAWRDDLAAVDFWIQAPNGEKLYQAHDRSEDSFQVRAAYSGVYRFCLENKEHLAETVEFNLHRGHVHLQRELAKDEHMADMLYHLEIIAMEVSTIQQDQAYFRGRERRRRKTNESTRRRIMWYAVLETLVLVGASGLQVYVLRSLFEKRGYGRA